MKLNIPNTLSLLRIGLVPICIIFYYLPVSWGHYAAAGIFMVAAITDFLDGYLARVMGQATKFGAFLDPVADKLMVAVVLVILVAQPGMRYLAIPAAIIVGREIIVSALREWMAEIGKRAHVKVSVIGKFKTTTQLISLIVLLLYQPGFPLIWQLMGGLLLSVSAGLTLWSMLIYLKAAWPDLTLSTES